MCVERITKKEQIRAAAAARRARGDRRGNPSSGDPAGCDVRVPSAASRSGSRVTDLGRARHGSRYVGIATGKWKSYFTAYRERRRAVSPRASPRANKITHVTKPIVFCTCTQSQSTSISADQQVPTRRRNPPSAGSPLRLVRACIVSLYKSCARPPAPPSGMATP